VRADESQANRAWQLVRREHQQRKKKTREGAKAQPRRDDEWNPDEDGRNGDRNPRGK
jgi:hypothetical protein